MNPSESAGDIAAGWLVPAVACEVLALFGVRVSPRGPAAGPSGSDPVKVVRNVVCVSTDRGWKVLKRSGLTLEEVWFVHRAKEHLARNGFTATDRYNLSASGQPFVTYEGGVYVLTDWLGGREADFTTPGDLVLAGRTLAALHRSSAGFAPGRAPTGRSAYGTWPGLFSGRLSQLERFVSEVGEKPGGRRDWFDAHFRRHAPRFIAAAHRAIEALAATSYGQESAEARWRGFLCHHDYSKRNLLVGGSGRDETYGYVVDFDYCLLDTPLHDVAGLIIRAAKQASWRPKACVAAAACVIDAYNREAERAGGELGAALALDRERLAIVLAVLGWPQDFWQLALQRYVEKQPWPEERYRQLMQKRVRHAAAQFACLPALASSWGLDWPRTW